ncbi:MAG: neutral zinc metallopeptidase [Tahibacter sp.]
MLWQKGRRSDNVVSTEGGGGGGPIGGGGGRGGLGIVGIIIVVIVGLIFGKNPLEILALLTGGGVEDGGSSQQTTAPPDDKTTDFVRAIVGSTEDVWTRVFKAGNGNYAPPQLVLFQGGVQSACGRATSSVGPFYCPGDRKVYLDTSFFDELSQRFHAAGDFARAYVIAHEVGHHIQNSIGVMRQVEEARDRGQPMEGATGLSVRQELQADCFAGVWANQAQQQLQWLEAGDIESALAAATAIGDDRLQKQSRGYVVPDSFTHGSSDQRVRWFRTGFQGGDLRGCDTFAARQL